MKRIDFYPKAKTPCGICHNMSHRGYVTVQALKEHRCIEKNCPFLQKLEHAYWKQAELKRLRKKHLKLLMRSNPTMLKDEAWKRGESMGVASLTAAISKLQGA